MANLPVLMYHSVCEDDSNSNGLTISNSKLEKQFTYLKENGYTTLHFKELSKFKNASQLPEKSVIITFDDVYVNQLTLGYPLLKHFGFKACFFIPFKYIGSMDNWNTGQEPIMSVEQLISLNPEIIELGLHSFSHGKYNEMTLEEIQADFDKCKNFIRENNLPVYNTLAYPYGNYPKKGKWQHEFFKTLYNNEIAYGLRIGNRINRFPFKNLYEVQRIDVKGEYDLNTFTRKLKKGKRWF